MRRLLEWDNFDLRGWGEEWGSFKSLFPENIGLNWKGLVNRFNIITFNFFNFGKISKYRVDNLFWLRNRDYFFWRWNFHLYECIGDIFHIEYEIRFSWILAKKN